MPQKPAAAVDVAPMSKDVDSGVVEPHAKHEHGTDVRTVRNRCASVSASVGVSTSATGPKRPLVATRRESILAEMRASRRSSCFSRWLSCFTRSSFVSRLEGQAWHSPQFM